MTSAEPMLEVRNLHVSAGGKPILRGVDLLAVRVLRQVVGDWPPRRLGVHIEVKAQLGVGRRVQGARAQPDRAGLAGQAAEQIFHRRA